MSDRMDRLRLIDEESEESGTDSGEEDLNGGAAACAAARIEVIGDELQELQEQNNGRSADGASCAGECEGCGRG